MRTEYWLTNISNRNIGLADLNLTIKAYSSINLLDKKHYHYELEQLLESEKSGSIFLKKDRIFVRKVAPTMFKMNIPINKETYIPTRQKSVYSIKEERYEELLMTDEEFAKENAALIELDSIKTKG